MDLVRSTMVAGAKGRPKRDESGIVDPKFKQESNLFAMSRVTEIHTSILWR